MFPPPPPPLPAPRGSYLPQGRSVFTRINPKDKNVLYFDYAKRRYVQYDSRSHILMAYSFISGLNSEAAPSPPRVPMKVRPCFVENGSGRNIPTYVYVDEVDIGKLEVGDSGEVQVGLVFLRAIGITRDVTVDHLGWIKVPFAEVAGSISLLASSKKSPLQAHAKWKWMPLVKRQAKTRQDPQGDPYWNCTLADLCGEWVVYNDNGRERDGEKTTYTGDGRLTCGILRGIIALDEKRYTLIFVGKHIWELEIERDAFKNNKVDIDRGPRKEQAEKETHDDEET